MKKNLLAMFAFAMATETVEKYSREENGNEKFFAATGDFDDNEMFAAIGGQSSSQEPYKLTVKNNHATLAETAILFGYNKFSMAANYGSGADIVITMSGDATYPELLAQSASEPFEVVNTRIQCSDSLQLSTSLVYKQSDPSGDARVSTITPDSYISPSDNRTDLVDVPSQFRIDGRSRIEYSVAALKTVNFSFFVSAKVNVAKALAGKAAVTEFGTQRLRMAK